MANINFYVRSYNNSERSSYGSRSFGYDYFLASSLAIINDDSAFSPDINVQLFGNDQKQLFVLGSSASHLGGITPKLAGDAVSNTTAYKLYEWRLINSTSASATAPINRYFGRLILGNLTIAYNVANLTFDNSLAIAKSQWSSSWDVSSYANFRDEILNTFAYILSVTRTYNASDMPGCAVNDWNCLILTHQTSGEFFVPIFYEGNDPNAEYTTTLVI